ncbi:hypothetical protein PENTCL1PPCAC_29488, partial [Pristionchus entomophagus]
SSSSSENSSAEETQRSDEPEYEVAEILKDKLSCGIRQYYVKWKDQLNQDGTIFEEWSLDKWDQWLTEEDMKCPELLQEYNDRKAKEREERSKKKHRDTPDKTSKKGKTPRKSSKKKNNKKIFDSDEDKDEYVCFFLIILCYSAPSTSLWTSVRQIHSGGLLRSQLSRYT